MKNKQNENSKQSTERKVWIGVSKKYIILQYKKLRKFKVKKTVRRFSGTENEIDFVENAIS